MLRQLAFSVTLCLPSMLWAQAPARTTPSVPEVVVSGSGVIKLKPDRATVTIAVVTRGGSAAAAGRLNVQRILPVLAALRRAGLPDSALVTTGYTVSLERDLYGRPPVPPDVAPTYLARNAVRATLTNLETLGQLLDSALAAGATEVANITFASSQAPEARQRAIAIAIRAARADAEAAANAAGGILGDVIEISLVPENGVAGGMVASYSEAAYAGPSTPLMPSDVSVIVQARVRFAFVPRP